MGDIFSGINSWYDTPVYHECEYFSFPGVKQIFLDSVPYKGKPTRVFACYGLPEGASADKPVPAVVLVHGGGGTALANWVALWNRRGYAAISMDTCGCVPAWSPSPVFSRIWPQHADGGPRGWGRFGLAGDLPQDQWVFHAVAAVIKSHSFLRSLPEVDSSKIGITGISWGGFLSCIAAGLDDRFKFAVPVYGCGYLDHPDCDVKLLEDDVTPENVEQWCKLWDSSHYLGKADVPMFFFTGTNDVFSMGAWLDSLKLVKDAHRLVRHEYPHNHTISWEEETIFKFADSVISGKCELLPRFSVPESDGKKFSCQLSAAAVPVKCELLWTRGSGCWQGRKWGVSAAVFKDGCISAEVKFPVTAAFFNASFPDGTTYTSPEILF